MKILHLTDLHLGCEDSLNRCKSLLNHIKREKADLLVIAGDIAAEKEDLLCYRFLKNQLDDMPFPFVILPGNHDRGSCLREVFESRLRTGFSRDCDYEKVLYFDNSTEHPHHLQELEQHLNLMAEPACLFTHYPPVPVDHPSYDGKHSLCWREEFWAAFQGARSPLFVFFGHIHFNFVKEVGKFRLYSTPSAIVPTIRGKTEDIPDESGLYFREICSSNSGWKTNLRITPYKAKSIPS